MSKVFFSFLGTSPYVRCNYGGNDCWWPDVQFVQTATLHLKCADWGPNDRVVIGCTASARATNLELLKSELTASGWSVEPEVVDLPDATCEEELWTIFQQLLDHIAEGDELVFDITHSFRSLPMLFTVLIQYLGVVRKVRLRGVYYGAFERLGRPDQVKAMPLSERNAPIIDLTAFLTLYDWSAGIDHFLRFGSATDLERLVNGHIAPILRRTGGADENARTMRGLVKHLGDFARGAQYVRGKELCGLAFQSQMVAPLQRVGQDFLPPLGPIFERLAGTFADWPDQDPSNALRTVGWCIEHGLIQQGITLLQEFIVDEWVRRCADVLAAPSEDISRGKRIRWQRTFISSLLAVIGQRYPPDQWQKPLSNHLAVARACAGSLPDGLALEYDKLSKLRNDINHGGYADPLNWRQLHDGLRQGYIALQRILHASTERIEGDARNPVYLLNTPILTAYGDFRFSGPIPPGEARNRLAGGFISAIGHEASAAFLSALLNIVVPANRIAVTMAPGDSALVLRLTQRLPEGVVLGAAELAAVPFELSWLERVA